MKKVTWRKPEEINSSINNKFTAEVFTANFLPDQVTSIHDQLLFPVVEGAESPKEELIYLLKIAAEIEHALMVQYLYAAYAIKEDSSKLRSTLIQVAIQEMGHFLAVQNLLLSVGGIEHIHLSKSEYRPISSDNPLPYTLEPISKELLAKFVAIEAPLEIPASLKQEIEAIQQIAKGKAGVSLNPVGGLYIKIFWLFQKDDDQVSDLMRLTPTGNLLSGWHVKDIDFLPLEEIEKYEAIYDIWDRSGAVGAHSITLTQVHNREEALKLVYQISSQGEGADFDDEIPTHFELFLSAYRDYSPTAQTYLNAPVNPVSRPNTEFNLSIQIQNPYSLLWNSLFNSLYSSLLLDIYSSMFYKQYSIDTTTKFTAIIFSSMKNIITTISTLMLKLPLLNNDFQYDLEPRCGATFEIDPDFKLEQKKEQVDQLNSKFITVIREKINLIKNHPDFKKHLEADGLEERAIVSFALSQAENYCLRKSKLLPINDLI